MPETTQEADAMEAALAEQQSNVPALAYSSDTDITSDDVALPRIKRGEHMSPHVQEGRAKYGCIFTELGSDDPDPITIAEAGNPTSEPVKFYVLSGPVKGWSYSEKGGELQTWRFSDPERHPDADKTYKYLVAIPDVDTELPYSILFTRTSSPAARQLNTILAKAAAQGPTHEVPLELTATKKSREQYKWAVYGVRRADIPEKERQADIEKVRPLVEMAQSQPEPAPAANERPEI